MHQHIKIPAGKMESKSMSMIQFIPYEVKPPVRAVDPYPDVYVPNMAKFVGETTTGQTYQGQKGYKPPSYKPDYDNIKIDKSQAIDASSSYRNTFINHGLSMCEAKAYIIASGLANKSTKELESPAAATTNIELTNMNSVQI